MHASFVNASNEYLRARKRGEVIFIIFLTQERSNTSLQPIKSKIIFFSKVKIQIVFIDFRILAIRNLYQLNSSNNGTFIVYAAEI